MKARSRHFGLSLFYPLKMTDVTMVTGNMKRKLYLLLYVWEAKGGIVELFSHRKIALNDLSKMDLL